MIGKLLGLPVEDLRFVVLVLRERGREVPATERSEVVEDLRIRFGVAERERGSSLMELVLDIGLRAAVDGRRSPPLGEPEELV